jgi:hypothetical protein
LSRLGRDKPAQNGDKGVDSADLVSHVRYMWRERDIQAIASNQYGLITRAQAVDLGATDHEIGRRMRAGRLEQPHRGVYYLNSSPATWKTEVMASVMAGGPGALASHRTAAVLWGFDAVYGRMIELTVPFNEEPDPAGTIVHRTRRLNPGTVLEGIALTSPEKTLLDLASLLPERTLIKAARSAVFKKLTTIEGMDLAVGTYGGRGVSGTRKIRRVIRIVADDKSGSVAEIDLNQLVATSPIPPPVQQLRIRLPDGSYVYPDLAWPDRMRIVEADGFETHGTPEQLENDLWRQNQLMDIGWEMRRFTASQIRNDPEAVRAEIIRFVNKPF